MQRSIPTLQPSAPVHSPRGSGLCTTRKSHHALPPRQRVHPYCGPSFKIGSGDAATQASARRKTTSAHNTCKPFSPSASHSAHVSTCRGVRYDCLATLHLPHTTAVRTPSTLKHGTLHKTSRHIKLQPDKGSREQLPPGYRFLAR